MKKMTKKTALIIAIAMICMIALIGCSTPAAEESASSAAPAESSSEAAESSSEAPAESSSESAEASSDTPAEGNPLPEDGILAFSQTSLSYFFFVSEQEAVEKGVNDLGYEFITASAEFEAITENNNFNNFLSQNPIGIIADPADTDGIVASLEKCAEQGVPVAIIDAVVGEGGKAGITITFDNYAAGYAAGEEIVRLLTEKYGEPKGNVLHAYGVQNNQAIRLRGEGFRDAFADYPDIEVVDVPGEGNLDDTLNATLNAMAQYGDDYFDAMHAPSDSPCMGLYEALNKSDRLFKVGEEGHVIIVTIDGEPIALERIRDGYYDSTIHQDAIAYGELAVEFMETYLLRGLDVPVGLEYANDRYVWETATVVDSSSGPMMHVPHTVVTKDMVEDERLWGNRAETEYGLVQDV